MGGISSLSFFLKLGRIARESEKQDTNKQTKLNQKNKQGKHIWRDFAGKIPKYKT